MRGLGPPKEAHSSYALRLFGRPSWGPLGALSGPSRACYRGRPKLSESPKSPTRESKKAPMRFRRGRDGGQERGEGAATGTGTPSAVPLCDALPPPSRRRPPGVWNGAQSGTSGGAHGSWRVQIGPRRRPGGGGRGTPAPRAQAPHGR
eukprot:1968365-Pyramimonas_sp.AAC.1